MKQVVVVVVVVVVVDVDPTISVFFLLLLSGEFRGGGYPIPVSAVIYMSLRKLIWFLTEIVVIWIQYRFDKLINNGGYNCVYKGLLPSGKPVAVKVLKSSKEACKDFTQEVDIMSSLKHKSITPLLGICVEDNELIPVNDFLSGGNLEENLHGLLEDGWEIYANWLISEVGNSKETSVLSWELRFKPAVEIVEALNYLHNECSWPVIHRDAGHSQRCQVFKHSSL